MRVGLGTDGPASNDDLHLWDEMRLAALFARATGGDPGAVSTPAALRLATRGGGEALGLPVGALEVGRPADVIRLRTDDPRFTPSVTDAELLGHLVWAGAGYLVTDVWVGGSCVVGGGRCTHIDEERARAEVAQRARRLLGLVGFPPMPGFVDQAQLHARAATAAPARCRGGARRTSTGAVPTAATAGTAGDVWLVASENESSLLGFRDHPFRRATDGGHGSGSKRHGARGKDIEVPVPVGTVVRDREGEVVCDLDHRRDALPWWPRAARVGGATRASCPTAGGRRPSPSRARRVRSSGSTWSSS